MKEKINTKRLLTTIGIVLLASAAVGGTTWWFMNREIRELMLEQSLMNIDNAYNNYCESATDAADENDLVKFAKLQYGISEAKIEETEEGVFFYIGYVPVEGGWNTSGYSLACRATETEGVSLTDNETIIENKTENFTLGTPAGWTLENKIADGLTQYVFTKSGVGTVVLEIGYGGRGFEGTKRVIEYEVTANKANVTYTKLSDITTNTWEGGETSGYFIISRAEDNTGFVNKDNFTLYAYGDDDTKATEAEKAYKQILDSIEFN
ncbi:MAG: hypothetical protein PHW75_01390 [Patescibacteria group bacterium]|nr:hypothetical protein [Patescibacteria group bacterium]